MGFFSKPGTMILGEGDLGSCYLKRLLELKARVGDEKEELEQEICRTEEGIRMERQLMELFSHSGRDMVVLRGFRLSDEDRKELVDFYVITPKIQFLVNCRTLGKPMERGENQLELLRDKKRKKATRFQALSLDTQFDHFFKSVVVTPNPEEYLTVQEGSASFRSQVVAPEGFMALLDKLNSSSSAHKLSRREMQKGGQHMAVACQGEDPFYEERWQRLWSGTYL